MFSKITGLFLSHSRQDVHYHDAIIVDEVGISVVPVRDRIDIAAVLGVKNKAEDLISLFTEIDGQAYAVCFDRAAEQDERENGSGFAMRALERLTGRTHVVGVIAVVPTSVLSEHSTDDEQSIEYAIAALYDAAEVAV